MRFEKIPDLRHGFYVLMITMPSIYPRTRFSRVNKHSRFYVCNIADLVEFIRANVITDEHFGMTDIQTKFDVFRSEKSGAWNDNGSESYCPLIWGYVKVNWHSSFKHCECRLILQE